MKDTRLIQARELIEEAQTILYALADENHTPADHRDLMAAADSLREPRSRLQLLGQCGNQAAEGLLGCGLPDGHTGHHQRSFNGGLSRWNTNGELVG